MTFEERLVELLVEKVVFSEGFPEREDDFIAAEESLAKLVDRENWPSQRPEVFWGELMPLVSPTGPFQGLIVTNNIGNVEKLVELARKVDPETWERDYNTEHGYHFHSFATDNDMPNSTSKDGDPTSFYYYNDQNSPEGSLAFIDVRDEFIIPPGILFADGDGEIQAITSLLMLENLDDITDGSALISLIENPDLAKAQLKYHLVLSGHSWSKPIALPSTATAFLSDLRSSIGNPEDFQQFTEPFSMLSEVNASDGILQLFLSTYHALENYMVRSKVADTFTQQGGRPFQRVRDFKRLGTKIDLNESKFLSDLFGACSDNQIGGETWVETAVLFRDQLNTDQAAQMQTIEIFFQLLDVKKNNNGTRLNYSNHINGNEDALRNNFPLLVYGIRCAIVHNKATEFHISNESLRDEPVWQALIAKLCLPVMLRMAFGLPSVANIDNPIRYSSKTISLY